MKDTVHEDNSQQVKVRKGDRIKRLAPSGPGGRGSLLKPQSLHLKDLESWEGRPGAKSRSRLKPLLGSSCRLFFCANPMAVPANVPGERETDGLTTGRTLSVTSMHIGQKKSTK